jgi:hypothetical protein
LEPNKFQVDLLYTLDVKNEKLLGD